MQIIDMLLIAAMGPPGGGRAFITNRMLRHFNTVAAAQMDIRSLKLIFSKLSNFFLSTFEPEVQQLKEQLLLSSTNIYTKISDELLPTPSKPHYLFNLRDIWKVFQGLCSLNPKRTTTAAEVIKCWAHENSRVFMDRLVSAQDQEWMYSALEIEFEAFGTTKDQVYENGRLVFTNFMESSGDTKFYCEAPDMTKVIKTLEEMLDDYNNSFTQTMPLVIFSDAAEHVARVVRVLNSPSGNALLLGVGGSGRQSLSRLASFVLEFDCFQIEVGKGYGMNEFKDDLRVCLMKCGVEAKVQTFLFCDTQIVKEEFVEALNNILNSGDVPNLYKVEDQDAIFSSCRPICTQMQMQPTKANIFAVYISRVKSHVHVVLAFSPVGDDFRRRVRMFPSLVNCCTMDWFHEWPAEALKSVGVQQLSMEDLKLENFDGVVALFKTLHQSAEKCAKRSVAELSRQVYITPTSYLELISAFKAVLARRRRDVGQLHSRLKKGLDALMAAEYAVANMEKELVAMQPVLAKTKKEVGEMMVVIQKDKAKAAVKKEECTKTEEEATASAAKATAIKEDAQRDLDQALPMLDAAVKCLQSLKLSHVQEVKALLKPPGGVKLTVEAVCIMFQIKPQKKADPDNPTKKIDDYWDVSKTTLMKDPKQMLEDLFSYDKDNIPDKVINAIEPYIKREDFDPAAIKKASVACEAMCMWARAMYSYHFVSKAVEPKRQALAIAEAEFAESSAKLAAAQAELQATEEKLAKLEENFNGAVKKQDELTKEMETCALKLDNAGKLISGLGGEKSRWTETVAELEAKVSLLPGDSIIAAGFLSYAGPYNAEYRQELQTSWTEECHSANVRLSEGATLTSVLGSPVAIQQWMVRNLPNDALSVENGIIIERSRRWPLMIDPQRQANKFMKTHGKLENEAGLDTCKLSDTNFLRTLELGIQFGKWILLENIAEMLDPALEPILQQQKVKDGSGFTIKLGDKVITYMDTFRFFMTTTLPNPHYSPEISVKVTLLNFAITLSGLEDQMLGLVMLKEQPEMEEKKQALVKDSAHMNKVLKDLEDEILRLLSADGDILESKELITTLDVSKETSAEIAKKMAEAKVTNAEIDVCRNSYVDYAKRSALLFFCVTDLNVVDPMYQYSLQWFQTLAGLGIDNAPAGKGDDAAADRLQNLIAYFTYSLYQAVCRGLFEAHKMLFSFALTLKILAAEGRIDLNELRFLLTGPLGEVDDPRPIPQEWLTPQMWNEILTLEQLPKFAGLADAFKDLDFKPIYDTPDAHTVPLPGKWNDHLNTFQKVVFLRTIRIDKVSDGCVNFVIEAIGQKFVEPPTFDISVSYSDSTKLTPLIFVLSPGSDPVADMVTFATDMNCSHKLEAISLGQGQGPKAVRFIEQAKTTGGWVLLCNCHLAASWLPELERICEQLNPQETHNEFRLWLTSMPTKAFPPLLLQNGVKMTNEPPKGLRANLLGSYSKLDDGIFFESSKPVLFRRMLFAFCFFHAIVQDRRKFGPIGWNIAYGFTYEDLVTCRRQLKIFVDDYDEPGPMMKVLQFCGAAINYGGRVTDDKDKRLIATIMRQYVCLDLAEKGSEYKFSKSGIFYCPDCESKDEFIDYLKTLPLQPSPEAFGLDENCEITTSVNESTALLNSMLSMAPKQSGGGGKSQSDVMDEIAEGLQEKVPPLFDYDDVEEQFPTRYEESTNTVLKQEVLKYNRLLKVMRNALPLFRKALKGLVAMSEELDQMGTALYGNQVPGNFAAVSYLNEKPLSAWASDLLDRVTFMNSWIACKKPSAFWVSGFFFPQAFFTATLQNNARKHKIAIDRLSYSFALQSKAKVDGSDLTVAPEEGCYIYGLFIEGCRWDFDEETLTKSIPKQLYSQMPPVLLTPEVERQVPPGCYNCPIYKVLSRKGTLSTTGHSTNFVMYVDLPTKNAAADVWTVAGAACFLALRT